MTKIVIPCSGIGKAFGTVAREATYRLTDSHDPENFKTICLPLLMTDDEDVRKTILENDIYTIDGCPKKCASSLVHHAGGNPVLEIIVPKVLAANKDHKPETVLEIGVGGRELADDIAKQILEQGGSK